VKTFLTKKENFKRRCNVISEEGFIRTKASFRRRKTLNKNVMSFLGRNSFG